MSDPLLRGIDPWAEPTDDGCRVCFNDGEVEDGKVCPECYPNGLPKELGGDA